MDGLVLDGLTHSYDGTDQPVVRDVSLHVAPGELVCLLGPSGCGKTTTLRIAAGLETARQGRVRLNGRLVSGDGVHLPPEERNVGFLFQDYALFPHLSVRANVEFGLTALPKAERKKRALEQLAQVGMADYAKVFPHQLSGGQQQRVALARALAPGPTLMLLDEPFSSLDKRLRDQIRDETLHVLKQARIATLMVTHDPEEAMFMADRIAVMQAGRIVQLDRPEELYHRPRTPFVAAFFGEVNVLPAVARGGRVETALGGFDAPGLADGAGAEVLIRPEAISLTPAADGIAIVHGVRLLGRSTLAHLGIEAPGHPPQRAQVRLSGGTPPAEGERVALSVSPAQVFVFPAPA
jgi:ABC-type spermidine/putrescine transport systems, ATPase components